MGKWQERIDSHPVKIKLDSLGVLLSELSDVSGMSPDAIESFERLRDVERYASDVLNGIDPALIPLALVAKLDAPLQNLINEISAYKSNKNEGHLENANSHADALLANILSLPAPAPNVALEGVRETVTSFRRSAGQLLAALERDANKLRDDLEASKRRIDEMAGDISNQKSRLDSAISEYQQQFSQSENTRREEFAKSQASNAQQVKDVVERHEEDLRDALSDAQARLSGVLTSGEEDLRTQLSQAKDQVKTYITELEDFRDKAQGLLHVIGSTGMSGEFQKAATSARRTVWLWQTLAVLAMVGLIWFAISAFHVANQAEFGLPQVGARIFVALSFGLLAVFAVRQNDRYHESEQRNRRYQLELSSIDPYLSGLPDEIRDDVKVKLAERLFGNAGISASPPAKNISGNGLDVVKMALEALQDLIKSGHR